MKKQDTVFLLWNAVTPLLTGAVFYALVSPNVRFVRAAEELFPFLSGHLSGATQTAALTHLRGILPDALWAYALIFALAIVSGKPEKDLWRVGLTAFVFSAVLECLQLIPDLHGTFDVWDIAVEWGAEALALFRVLFCFKREGKKQ